ncbi:hypothetical protein Q1695_013724 [Nippostrongylus brasiliensis]|nr:hypothetical protein Q1695_013724 [Nippostrongylus brasiliensis]
MTSPAGKGEGEGENEPVRRHQSATTFRDAVVAEHLAKQEEHVAGHPLSSSTAVQRKDISNFHSSVQTSFVRMSTRSVLLHTPALPMWIPIASVSSKSARRSVNLRI